MVIGRRTLLKQLAVVSAGAVLSQSFIGCKSRPSLLFKNVTVTQDQEELLSLLAETIIPKTNTPGAKEVNAHLYSAKMIDDCLSKKDQDKWLSGLNQFEKTVKEKTGDEFTSLGSEEREKFLIEIEESKTENDISFFYKTTKRLTLRGYTSSEYFLTQQGFSLIPGRFKGCVAVNNPS